MPTTQPAANSAVAQAMLLKEIQFPEFTAKLITDTFDAIVAANMKQTQSYIELVKEVSKTITEFAEDNKDDISGEMILQMLTLIAADEDSPQGTYVTSDSTKVLTQTEADTLNQKLKINETDAPVVTGAPISSQYTTILDAVAKRIAADKYILLNEMVKMGILRLVVVKGNIETKLTFNNYCSSYYEKNKTDYQSRSFNLRTSAKTGSILSGWIKASAAASFNTVHISTVNETNRDVSGTQVQIYGGVQIEFKTDYQPLNV